MAQPAERFPPQVKYIVGTEGCERFSFYGMRAILVVYMTQWLGMADHAAKGAYHDFMTACYVMPLLGAFLADRYWGRYKTIVWLSLGYVAGHATIAVWETRWGLAAGLFLIALGSGGIKPCVSAIVGDQFRPDQAKLVERVFALFYWMINLGSVTAKLSIPLFLKWNGPTVAFAVPGLLMVVALAIFVAGRGLYVRHPPSGRDPHAFTRIVATAVRRRAVPAAHWLDRALAEHPAAAVDGARAVLRVAAVFAATLAFWALFDQQGSSWILQAKAMELGTPWGALQASQIPFLNPFLVLLLIPAITRGAVPAVEALGVRVTPLRKMSVGMFIGALSFVAAALVQQRLDAGARLHVAWQLPQYLVLTTSEVLVSITALEFAYTQAPRSMKSTVMSLWLLTTAAGNQLTATVSKVNAFQGASYFWFFAALMLGAAVLFTAVAARYRPVPLDGAA